MKLISIAIVAALAASVGSCARKEPPGPPVAKPSVTLSTPEAPLGSPIDVTYKFEVDANAPPFTEDYKVFVGIVDADESLMWTDDHDPAIPTTQWKPGQVIEYTRTVFIPLYPYIGEASFHMGLYSLTTQKRLTLAGEDAGQLAYRVAKIELLPQTENIVVMFKDGWNGPESAPGNSHVEWQWSKRRQATLEFQNPKKDSMLYLDLDNPSQTFPEGQNVQVKVADQVVAEVKVQPGNRILHRIPLPAAQLGSSDLVELTIDVDKTFVPALLPASTNKDPRELGVRVFHAFVEAKP